MTFPIPGIGTACNALAIVAGGLVGVLFKKRLNQNLCRSLMQALGAAVIFIGLSGTLTGMLTVKGDVIGTKGVLLFILSLVIGTLVGSILGIKRRTEQFGEFLKKRFGGENDTGFVASFVSASLTVCVGAMAVLGSMEDGMHRNPETLFAKALLDALIIMIFASVTGKGAIFSAIPVAVFQGSITLVSVFAADFLSATATANMSYVGSVLVFLVGINLMFDKDIPVADMLPAIFVAGGMAYLPVAL